MKFFYAQIDDDNRVIGVSALHSEIDEPNLVRNLVRLDSFDVNLLGCIYDPDTGSFSP